MGIPGLVEADYEWAIKKVLRVQRIILMAASFRA